MLSNELGFAVTLVVATSAGFVRGFTGFGGPAFTLATLAWVYIPLVIVAKILIIEMVSATYLFAKIRHEINWRDTAAITIPTHGYHAIRAMAAAGNRSAFHAPTDISYNIGNMPGHANRVSIPSALASHDSTGSGCWSGVWCYIDSPVSGGGNFTRPLR